MEGLIIIIIGLLLWILVALWAIINELKKLNKTK